MTVTYRVVILAPADDGRVAELTAALDVAVLAAGFQGVELDVVTGGVGFDPSVPTVAVYLGSRQARADPALDRRLSEAIELARYVLPVVSSLEAFHHEIPTRIGHVNGEEWHEARVAAVLLRELGLHEDRREVFLSHKRSESMLVAEQLHTHLEQRRFRVFVDRFDLEPGASVQAEILDAIDETGFFVLLETELAHESRWVQTEVLHAEAALIPRLILRWPEVADGQPRTQSELTSRVVLEDGTDLVPVGGGGQRELTAEAVERVGDLIEAAHAAGLARRRTQLVGSVLDHLDLLGIPATELTGWRFALDLVEPHWLQVAPRRPTVTDLHRLYGDAPDCSYVYGAAEVTPRVGTVLDWAIGGRNVSPVPIESIGEHLTDLVSRSGR